MLPGTISRLPVRFGGPYITRALRWAEPLNVSTRVQAQLATFFASLSLMMIVGIAISALKVTIRLQVQDLQIRTSASRAFQGKLIAEHDRLEQEHTDLLASKAIEARALGRLGMMRPQLGQEVRLP